MRKMIYFLLIFIYIELVIISIPSIVWRLWHQEYQIKQSFHTWLYAPDHRMDGRILYEAAFHEAQLQGWGQLAAQDYAMHRMQMMQVDISQHTGVPR